MGLTKTAIERPVFILMLMLVAVLMGLISYNSMRTELNPDVDFGVVSVTTVYPGAGSDEINELISRKLEEAVSGVSNLREVTATSQEGVSSVVLQFEVGTNMDVAINDVRTKVESQASSLPKDALKPVVDKQDTASSPVLTIAIKSRDLSNRQLRDLADNTLKDKFARIKGVANIGISGGEQREIKVQIKKDSLLTYGLGIADVGQALQSASLNVPSGHITNGIQEYTVRVVGEFKKVEDIENSYLTIQGDKKGDPVKKIRVGDIASVSDGNVERRGLSRLNGTESVVMVIQKTKIGNAVEISDAIKSPNPAFGKRKQDGPDRNLLESLTDQYHVDFEVTNDTSTQIKESLQDLLFALGFGIVLVASVVYVFLHNFRGTMIVAIAIPVCIFATFIAMSALGFTKNNLSMLALSLAVGVLVDDCIVVLENIYRHLQMGEDPVSAAINGRAEIGLAAIAITLADVVVFLPIAFMGGIVGQFFRPLALGYAVCVMLSLFVSFTVTPMLASRWYRQGEDWEHPTGRFARWFEHGFERFANGYRNVLRFSLAHRWYMFGGGFAVLLSLFLFIGGSFTRTAIDGFAVAQKPATFVIALGLLIFIFNIIRLSFRDGRVYVEFCAPKFGILIGMAIFTAILPLSGFAGFLYAGWKKEAVFKFGFLPPSDSGAVAINIQLPPGASLSATQEVVARVEKVAMKHPDAEYVVSNIGTQGGGFGAASAGTQYAQITVTLSDKVALLDSILFWQKSKKHQRTASDSSVAADILQGLGRVPGAKVNVTAAQNFNFGSAIQLALKGDNREKLLATAVKLRDGLATGAVSGVVSPDISSKPGKPEFQAIPNRAKMAEANVSVAQIGAALRVLYEGDNTTKFRVNGKEYDVRVQMAEADRNNPNLVSELPVTFSNGKPLFLNELATLQNGQSVDKIDRRDRQETITVTADLLPGFASGTVQAEIDKWLATQKILPEGITLRALGQADAQQREGAYLLAAIGIGLVLVYMILASLYDNLIYPLIIQLAQPQAMIGALLALIFSDKTLNIVGMIGIIALIGLVGKNAILLVDYTNTLRERGEDRLTALVESGGTRLRPIVMTTLALVVGTLPVALAIGRGSEFRETIGIAIIGGVLLSTVLSLLVIPCSYSIFDDASQALGRIFRSLSRK